MRNIKLPILFTLLLFAYVLSAQQNSITTPKFNPILNNEISVGYGKFNYQDLYFGIIANDNDKSGLSHLGTFNFSFMHKLTDKILLGMTFSYDRLSSFVKDTNGVSLPFKGNMFTIMPSVKYYYLNKKFGLYATMGIGVLINQRNMNINIINGVFGDVKYIDDENATNVAFVFSGTPFGLQYNNRIIIPYFEIGIGMVYSWLPLFPFSTEGLIHFGFRKDF